MALGRQPKTAGFRPISKYECIVPRLSRCWTAEATVVAKIFSFGAERLMELESLSNLPKMEKAVQFRLKKIGQFGFELLVG